MLTLPPTPFPIPGSTFYSHISQAWSYIGPDAAAKVTDLRPGTRVALDIETVGLDRFNIRCVTAAWREGAKIISVFLDPREPRQAAAVRHITDTAGVMLLHNATFDIPPMYHTGLMALDSVYRVYDTLVLARMRDTSNRGSRDLETLTATFTTYPEVQRKMTAAFSAMGYTNSDDGYAAASVPDPVWRAGAMADTVATLMLWDPLYEAVMEEQLRYAAIAPSPWWDPSRNPREQFQWLIEREQRTNQVMLRRSAVGIQVDTDYLDSYLEHHMQNQEKQQEILRREGLDPTSGKLSKDLVELIDRRGELPSNWERTKTGQLAADKRALESLKHPTADAVRSINALSKVTGYLIKTRAMSRDTGRIHPQVGVLGAHATGRMAYSSPELQQFPRDARPILVSDPGRQWQSIDWSSIEPVVLANAAGDDVFLSDFNKGGDLYIPAAKVGGLIPEHLSEAEAKEHPGRKQAKVVVLANMYGQGKALLARNLGLSEQEALGVKEQYNRGMEATVKFLNMAKSFADRHGFVRTLDGRGLSIPENTQSYGGKYAGYKAMNYFVQGSAYSLLSETINEIRNQGLEDAIQLAMHDELVVDTEAAHDIQKIMVTSPQWLNAVAGKEVYLASDSQPLGTTWKYV